MPCRFANVPTGRGRPMVVPTYGSLAAGAFLSRRRLLSVASRHLSLGEITALRRGGFSSRGSGIWRKGFFIWYLAALGQFVQSLTRSRGSSLYQREPFGMSGTAAPYRSPCGECPDGMRTTNGRPYEIYRQIRLVLFLLDFLFFL